MDDKTLVRVDGEVGRPRSLVFDDLAAIDPQYQIANVRDLGANRDGAAVTLAGVLSLVDPSPAARYLTLHATADDFHASIPLSAVLDRGLFIYADDGEPLSVKAGGPLRFFIPDHAACQADEIDECANVKFVDHVELSTDRGHDNRPTDDQEHEKLHENQ